MLGRLFLSALALTQAAFALPIQKRDFSGEATYYAVGLGACGQTNSDSEYVVAMNAQQYGNGEYCGQSVTITYNGKTTSATVVDKCPGCAYGDLDMSPTLFSYFADQSVGRFTMSWNFGSGSGSGSSGGDTTTSSSKDTPAPTSEYTPPATSEYTPPATSTYVAPTSTYVAPTSTYTPPAPTSTQISSPAADLAAQQSTTTAAPSSLDASTTSAVPSSLQSSIAASISASLAASIAQSLNATATLNATSTAAPSVSPVHVTVANASTTAPVDNVVTTSASDSDASGNLATFNSLVAALGRIVVIAAQ